MLEKLKTERDIRIIFTASSILLSIYGLKVTYSRRLRKKGEENTIKYLLWLIMLNKKEKKSTAYLGKNNLGLKKRTLDKILQTKFSTIIKGLYNLTKGFPCGSVSK